MMRFKSGFSWVWLVVAAGLLWAAPSTYAQCKSSASQEKKASSCRGLETSGQQTAVECPLSKQADALLAKWQAVPERLAGLSETEQAKRTCMRQKCVDGSPAAGQMISTLRYLGQAMKLIAALDEQVCGNCQNCAKLKKAVSEDVFQRWETRHHLTAKAATLYGTALASMCSAGGVKVAGCDWSCANVQAVAEKKACPPTCKGTAEAGKACCKDKPKCPADKGCSRGAPDAGKASCKNKPKCPADKGCCKGAPDAAKTCCKCFCGEVLCGMFKDAETLADKANAMTLASGLLLADWQRISNLTAGTDAEAVARCCKNLEEVRKCCPAGALVPETIKTVGGLLAESARLDACFAADCQGKLDLGKVLSEEVNAAYAARCRLTAAVLNVMEKMDAAMCVSSEAVADTR